MCVLICLALRTNARVLRRSAVYRRAQQEGLLVVSTGSVEGFPPYLFGDKGYPRMRWLMNNIKDGHSYTVLESIYNEHTKEEEQW